MKYRFLVAAILAIVMTFAVCACSDNPDPGKTGSPSATGDPSGSTDENDPSTIPQIEASDKFTKFDTTVAYNPAECTKIRLAQDGTTVEGDGATVSGNKITVGKAGSYILTGTLTDGQVIVSVEKTEKVRLILAGVSITNSSQAAIYVVSADKVGITLATGTENVLTDGSKYTGLNEKSEPTACLFSKDDLTINGYGTLTVNGNYNNGIASKNDLKIVSGNITVTAKNNAIKGKDSFLMNSGTLVVNSDDDGIKVNEDGDISKGFICIEGGTITVNAEDDALTAVYSVTITGGTVTTYVGGKAVNCTGTVNIEKGCLIEK